ncbi:AraC family transcriptional regulator [Nesterenkonia populi]
MARRIAAGIDEWSQICSDSFVPLRVSNSAQDFRASIHHLQLGEIGVSRVSSKASTVLRPAKLVAAEPRDDVLLSIQLSGPGAVRQADRSATLLPETGAIYEADTPYELHFDGPMSELVLQVPRHRLRLRDLTIREATARTVSSSYPLGVLRHLLDGILSAEQAPEAGLEEQTGEMAVDLLSSALRPFAGGQACSSRLSGETIYYAARAALEKHQADPSLSIDSVAQLHGISRRYLEALFKRHGTSPASYLQLLRVTRAQELLSGTTAKIVSIAHEVGFYDVNTFIRAFKRVTDMTPTQWRHDRR